MCIRDRYLGLSKPRNLIKPLVAINGYESLAYTQFLKMGSFHRGSQVIQNSYFSEFLERGSTVDLIEVTTAKVSRIRVNEAFYI